MKEKNIFLYFASFIILSSIFTGCATHKQLGSEPIIKGRTTFVQDPEKRRLDDKGPLFGGHRIQLKGIQNGLEEDLAEMEAERIRRDAAEELGIEYVHRTFGAVENSAVAISPVTTYPPQQNWGGGIGSSGGYRGGLVPSVRSGTSRIRSGSVPSVTTGAQGTSRDSSTPAVRTGSTRTSRGGGMVPSVSTGSQGAHSSGSVPAVRSGGGTRNSSGTVPAVRTRRSDSGVGGTLHTVAGGLRSFLLPTIGTGGTGTSLIYASRVSGRVNVPVSGFERSAREHAASIDPNLPAYRGRPEVRVTRYSAGAALAGDGRVRSGLRQ
ncbi:MAG: hypothetical protein A2849_00130 [Candidatus Taylorbacteria bacterium RIFCSPHIGHO2_01_FULL_51_15]|uniref:Uncharacterized protein n=1 Tax=Candidatus Taylorbacteria bacterium RIFCSPHIGHO2_01_FULL_51_15 TaxID=1802304 RepID=A0A1G2MBV1_9BACT|nr:MAG: hypothetical protein A2849_00130 [Candidatus Taylorbacteria bacterium RIFCSPHIGHO2_01_FULL_51_15]